jgi:hypothetical protein
MTAGLGGSGSLGGDGHFVIYLGMGIRAAKHHGTDGTGSGGGGGAYNYQPHTLNDGGAGGSGVVIIRYSLAQSGANETVQAGDASWCESVSKNAKLILLIDHVIKTVVRGSVYVIKTVVRGSVYV